MSFKAILVEVSPSADHALSLAAELGRRFGGQIHGLYARRPWSAPLLPTGGSILTAINEGMSDSIDRERSFLKFCRAQGVSGEWEESEGSRVALMAKASYVADIAVVQQQAEVAPWGQNLDDLPERLILGSACPVLMAPHSGKASLRAERVLIAWKYCREAARAAREAMPFLVEAKRVTVLNVGAAEDAARAKLVCGFLSKHGVRAEPKHLMGSDETVAESILSEAKALGSDLLVMGAYGHWRLQELVLGGVTRDILGKASLPVLFSH